MARSPAHGLASTQAFTRDQLTWLTYWMLAGVAYAQSTLGPAMPFLRDELKLTYTQGGFLPAAMALGSSSPACSATGWRTAGAVGFCSGRERRAWRRATSAWH